MTLRIPDNVEPETDNLTAALAYAAAGWYVLPVKNGTKNPGSVVEKGWQHKSSRDPKVLAGWFAGTNHGVALHAGRSGAVIFDVDRPDGAPAVLTAHLTAAPYQSSRPDIPGRGHYVFAQPPDRTLGNHTGRLGKGFGEIRGTNGVILVAPSFHKDGGRYEWVRTGPVPQLPDEIAELLPDGNPAEDAATDAAVEAFTDQHIAASRPGILNGWKRALANKIERGESRHESTLTVVTGAMKEARAGYFPAQAAIDTLKPMFTNAVALPPNARTGDAAEGEWAGILAWAVAQAAAANLDEVRARTAEKMPEQASAAADVVPDGSKFIHPRDGLLARDLAQQVTRSITCGHGDTDGRFYVYDAGVWLPNNGHIEAVIGYWLANRYRQSHARNVMDLIRFDPDTARITCEPTAEWINVTNGMLRWRDGTLHPHAPDYRSTTQLPVEYHPDADCPAFIEYLQSTLPQDCYTPDRDSPGFIWELIGYTLYAGNPLHIAVLLYGNGRNGKGALIRVLKRLIGERNFSSATLHELAENRFRAATLYGKLANLAGDLDSKWLDSTAMFKAITGGDTVQGEYKYGAAFDFTPWALPFYSTNKAFGSADSSEGWVARWVIVPFPNSFIGREDRQLDGRIGSEAELRGILRRAVAALPALMSRGRLPEPASVRQAKQAFVSASDAVRSWLDEHCTLDADAWTPRAELYRAYAASVEADGGKRLSARDFYGRVEQVNGVVSRIRQGDRGLLGVRLLDKRHGFVNGEGAEGAEGAGFSTPNNTHGKKGRKPAPSAPRPADRPPPDHCEVCDQELSAPVSIERGICERCHLIARRETPGSSRGAVS